jgi:tetratricopeptide (TPR) repeat protein
MKSLLKKGCELNYSLNIIEMGDFYKRKYHSKKEEKYKEKMLKYYKKASKCNISRGYMAVGTYYMDIEKDFEKARKYFDKAMVMGDTYLAVLKLFQDSYYLEHFYVNVEKKSEFLKKLKSSLREMEKFKPDYPHFFYLKSYYIYSNQTGLEKNENKYLKNLEKGFFLYFLIFY